MLLRGYVSIHSAFILFSRHTLSPKTSHSNQYSVHGAAVYENEAQALISGLPARRQDSPKGLRGKWERRVSSVQTGK